MSVTYCVDAWPQLCLSAEAWALWALTAALVLVGLLGVVALSGQAGRVRGQERRRRRADEVQRLSIIANALFHCRALCEQMSDRSQAGASIEQERLAVQAQAERLAAVPLLDIPDVHAADAISRAQLSATALERDLALGLGKARLREALRAAIGDFEAYEGTLRKALAERGADVPMQSVTRNGTTSLSLSVKATTEGPNRRAPTLT